MSTSRPFSASACLAASKTRSRVVVAPPFGPFEAFDAWDALDAAGSLDRSLGPRVVPRAKRPPARVGRSSRGARAIMPQTAGREDVDPACVSIPSSAQAGEQLGLAGARLLEVPLLHLVEAPHEL